MTNNISSFSLSLSFKCYLFVNKELMYIFISIIRSYFSIQLILEEAERVVVYKETCKWIYLKSKIFKNKL